MNKCNSYDLETNFLIELFKKLHKRELITKIKLDKCIQVNYKTNKGGKKSMEHVVAYCTVSTDKGDQVNSLESQKRYLGQYIKNNADWRLLRFMQIKE